MKINETKIHKKVDVGDIVKFQKDESTTSYRLVVLLKEGYNMIDLDRCKNAYWECFNTIDEMMLGMKNTWKNFDVIKSENIEMHIEG